MYATTDATAKLLWQVYDVNFGLSTSTTAFFCLEVKEKSLTCLVTPQGGTNNHSERTNLGSSMKGPPTSQICAIVSSYTPPASSAPSPTRFTFQAREGQRSSRAGFCRTWVAIWGNTALEARSLGAGVDEWEGVDT